METLRPSQLLIQADRLFSLTKLTAITKTFDVEGRDF